VQNVNNPFRRVPLYKGGPLALAGIVRNRVPYLYGVELQIDEQEDQQQIARLRHGLGGTTRSHSF
jgi:hypothetical protein